MKLDEKKVNHPITENTCPFCGEVHEIECWGTYCHLGSRSDKIESIRREMRCKACEKNWQTWYKCRFDYLAEDVYPDGSVQVFKLVHQKKRKWVKMPKILEKSDLPIGTKVKLFGNPLAANRIGIVYENDKLSPMVGVQYKDCPYEIGLCLPCDLEIVPD